MDANAYVVVTGGRPQRVLTGDLAEIMLAADGIAWQPVAEGRWRTDFGAELIRVPLTNLPSPQRNPGSWADVYAQRPDHVHLADAVTDSFRRALEPVGPVTAPESVPPRPEPFDLLNGAMETVAQLTAEHPMPHRIRTGSAETFREFARMVGVKASGGMWPGNSQMLGIPVVVDNRLPKDMFVIGRKVYRVVGGCVYLMDLTKVRPEITKLLGSNPPVVPTRPRSHLEP